MSTSPNEQARNITDCKAQRRYGKRNGTRSTVKYIKRMLHRHTRRLERMLIARELEDAVEFTPPTKRKLPEPVPFCFDPDCEICN